MVKTEAIVGYRSSWSFHHPNYLVSGNLVYEPRKRAEAKCNGLDHNSFYVGGKPREDHLAPLEGCSCGIYAFKQEAEAKAGHGKIYGEIYLWGKVIEHVRGYRAQYGYPKKLVICGKASDTLQAIAGYTAWLYGVELEVDDCDPNGKVNLSTPLAARKPLLTTARLWAAVLSEKTQLNLRRYARTTLRARLVQAKKRYEATLENLEQRVYEQRELIIKTGKQIDTLDILKRKL